MEHDFINLTPENLANEHLCCIIRSKSVHAGIEAKRQWLSERLKEGHVFRKLNEKATVFIEYAPLEAAWVPVVGDTVFRINRLRRSLVSRLPILPIKDMNCLRFLWTEQGRGLQKMRRAEILRIKS